MKKYTKRTFLKTAGSFGLYLAGANLPVWAINNLAYANTDSFSFKLMKKNDQGLMLPDGFTSRVIAKTNQSTSNNSDYKWHKAPDGGSVLPTDNDGWIYVSNSEIGGNKGGVGAIKFDKNANIIDSYSICSGTNFNCAGGTTPWNTWLTCEEYDQGSVWECDPLGKKKPVKYSALGKFTHEAAAFDPINFHVYLTEDDKKGGFFRFIPEKISSGKADLSKGVLQVAKIFGKTANWINVPDPKAKYKGPLMKRKKNKKIVYSKFNRGEGAWYHKGKIFFATTGDNSIWSYDIDVNQFKRIYRGSLVLTEPDNLTVSKKGIILAAEDSGNMEIVAISKNKKTAFPIVRIVGHSKSEITGPAFDPSGQRLYFSSQRGEDGKTGITYEVSGPFDKLA